MTVTVCSGSYSVQCNSTADGSSYLHNIQLNNMAGEGIDTGVAAVAELVPEGDDRIWTYSAF